MNDNQKEFLDKLAGLFDEYSIGIVQARGNRIVFGSNDSELMFETFRADKFYNLSTMQTQYAADPVDVTEPAAEP